jgi:hypothetical protein
MGPTARAAVRLLALGWLLTLAVARPQAATLPAGPYPLLQPTAYVGVEADSAQASPPQPATQAMDGNPLTRWISAPTAAPHWLTLALGRVHAVDGVQVRPRVDSQHLYGNITAYDIALSLDGQAWQTVAHGRWPGLAPGPHVVRFAPQRARYVRLTGLETAAAPFVGVAECGVYGVAVPGRRVVLGWDQEGEVDGFTLYRSPDYGRDETYVPVAEIPGTARTYTLEDDGEAGVCFVLTNWQTTADGQEVESVPNRWPVCLEAAPEPVNMRIEPTE